MLPGFCLVALEIESDYVNVLSLNSCIMRFLFSLTCFCPGLDLMISMLSSIWPNLKAEAASPRHGSLADGARSLANLNHFKALRFFPRWKKVTPML